MIFQFLSHQLIHFFHYQTQLNLSHFDQVENLSTSLNWLHVDIILCGNSREKLENHREIMHILWGSVGSEGLIMLTKFITHLR